MSVPATLAPRTLALLDVGPMEFIVIAAAAVMLFGGDLPDVMRRAGRFVARLRGMADELGRSAALPNDLARLPQAGEAGQSTDVRGSPGAPVQGQAGATPASEAPTSLDAGPSSPASVTSERPNGPTEPANDRGSPAS